MSRQNPPSAALDCAQVLDRLEAYLDGDLPAAEAALVRAHVEGPPAGRAHALPAQEARAHTREEPRCARCAEQLELARRLRQALRALPQEECRQQVVDRAFAIARAEGTEANGSAATSPRRHAPANDDAAPASPAASWWTTAAIAAAAALLLVLGLFGLARLLPEDAASTRAAVADPDVEGAADPTAQPDADDIERATAEARLALAYVASVGRHSALVLRDEVVADSIVAPSARALQRAIEPLRRSPDAGASGERSGEPR
ncbi:MAG TPA: zf-HC2 domain-containing protein [Thermoanaerobaculia bacterium]|nr:zf-HC2 domain-containing protein [Thermoanaerobaculia bacterium]